MIYPHNLPPQLQREALFCCWRYEERKGKRTKVPINPRTGGNAQSTNPTTFASLAEALAALERQQLDGIGVGIFGSLGAIDIDHCIDDGGVISDMALDIIGIMGSYWEVSPSGHGVRILFSASGFQYDKKRYYINCQQLGLEVYIAGCTNKYVTVTGSTSTPGMKLEERGAQLVTVLEKYMVRSGKKKAAAPPRPSGAVDLDDLTLINKAKKSRSGSAFSALWDGDTAGYKSHSEADLALCNALAFWTNCDAGWMDRLFRQSGLMRDKWDRPQSGSTYGAITIQNAISECRGGYDPNSYFRQKADRITTQKQGGTMKLADLNPERNDRYPWNDIGNGYLFADWYREQARYVPERKKWYVYTGRVWEPDTGNLKVMELCKKLADDLVCYALSLQEGAERDSYRKSVEWWQQRNHRETILKDAASVYPVKFSDFDADPYLFNCINGTLDLRTRELRAHSPGDMLTMVSGVKYDPDARPELFERFISDVTQGDRETATYIQKVLGYCLTGDTSEECYYTLYGATTRNGKSTMLETFLKLLGDYGRSAKPETFARKERANGSGPSEDLARLAGARMVSVAEVPRNMPLDASLMKTITGGDTIAARYLNENSFEYRPQFKLIFNTNWLPSASDVTLFSSDRVHVIPFERHFTEAERDKTLKARLAAPASLSGVLNWCLDGLYLWRETGIEPSQAVKKSTVQYQLDSDRMAQFIAEELEKGPDFEVKSAEVFVRYKLWCDRNNYRPGSDKTWKDDMKRLVVFDKKRPRGGGAATNVIVGYRLKSVSF